jgi:hypothetical protein
MVLLLSFLLSSILEPYLPQGVSYVRKGIKSRVLKFSVTDATHPFTPPKKGLEHRTPYSARATSGRRDRLRCDFMISG